MSFPVLVLACLFGFLVPAVGQTANDFVCAVAPSPKVYDEYRGHPTPVEYPEHDVPTPAETPQTNKPTSKPTSRPSAKPVSVTYGNTNPAQAPTVPSGSVTRPVVSSGWSGCDTAYIYCAGNMPGTTIPRSTCFIGTYSNGGGAWGWGLNVTDLTSTSTLTCDIYAGAGQCKLTNGNKIGTAIISAYSVKLEFYRGAGGQGFHLYAGKCPACDGGDSLPNSACSQSSMNSNARTPGQYTLVTPSYGKGYNTFEINSQNYLPFRKGNSNWGIYNYVPFPLGKSGGQNGWQYLTVHMDACPCGNNNANCY